MKSSTFSTILLLILVGMALISIILPIMVKSMKEKYFKGVLNPKPFSEFATFEAPAEAFIGVPSATVEKEYDVPLGCFSAITELLGRPISFELAAGVSGYCFGLSYIPRFPLLVAFTDPYGALSYLSEFWGVEMGVRTSEKIAEFSKGVKYLVCHGIPPIVPLEPAAFGDTSRKTPVWGVVVGYKDDTLKMYLPEKGDIVERSVGDIKKASEDYSRRSGFPWRHVAYVFGPLKEASSEWKAVLFRNGHLLVGSSRPPIYFGAKGLREAVKNLEKLLKNKGFVGKILPLFFESGVHTRNLAASFLEKYFRGEKVALAAEKLRKAAGVYKRGAQLVKYGKVDKQSLEQIFDEIADLEEQAGKLLIEASSEFSLTEAGLAAEKTRRGERK